MDGDKDRDELWRETRREETGRHSEREWRRRQGRSDRRRGGGDEEGAPRERGVGTPE